MDYDEVLGAYIDKQLEYAMGITGSYPSRFDNLDVVFAAIGEKGMRWLDE